MNRTALNRFVDAQKEIFHVALSEIRLGQKESHWMWFIFPQIKGLGRTDIAKFYSIENMAEATAYLSHPVLGKNLVEISEALLAINNKSAREILGKPDDRKLQSCMTLFSKVHGAGLVFKKVLDKYFEGHEDTNTLEILGNNYSSI